MARETSMADVGGRAQPSRCEFHHVRKVVLRNEPWDCKIGRDRNLYVAEVSRNRIIVLNKSTGRATESIAYRTESDCFRGPTSISINEQGSMFVADSGSGVIRVFQGEPLSCLSLGRLQPRKRRHIPTPGNFSFPHMVSTVDDMVWVCDPESCCVQALYLNGTCKYLIHANLTGMRVKVPEDGSFVRWRDLPMNLSQEVSEVILGPEDDFGLKVKPSSGSVSDDFNDFAITQCTDSGNHVLRFFNATNGAELGAAVGGWGRFVGELNYPTGLAMRSDGVLLVAESRNRRIQAFEMTREGVRWLGSSCERYMTSVTNICWDDNMKDIWACDPKAKSVRNLRLSIQGVGGKSESLKKQPKQPRKQQHQRHI
ncbi:hypothetical protein GUITHDRAFT_106667 [Guillardia theta CCMP2712]|uniref:SMP-30/Gluconolactonase/LRE-like region domain-containing protein n=1 Tax=Guillardia theta (strain CCMP2712) TaxID=905079 RepID=L1JHQ4_GUITC|nr:hypothetical protein GUITHDRAFT_106667 [Guillardia theta CCMP2712]EKX47679.1 hypothetical protein GUITHDRAFT_106667 [Guillardia theta CCMP2712]|eukprot:XP_005834659.1 hypothetical protein GUITHDRAFT_106667 [Guillardia theta CCMP2712]